MPDGRGRPGTDIRPRWQGIPAVAYFWKSSRTVAWYEHQPMRVGTPKINKKEGVTMPIKWNPLKVNEVMDTVEAYINLAIEPLELARLATREALKIPNLPQYVTQHLMRIIGDIDQTIGGSQWNTTGRLKAGIQSVRNDLPKEAIEEEKKKLESGSQLSLVN